MVETLSKHKGTVGEDRGRSVLTMRMSEMTVNIAKFTVACSSKVVIHLSNMNPHYYILEISRDFPDVCR